ncbi:hypothetical protein B0J11DRAFT_524387 [Dendryphion nanum]|uniref:Uncharacterized protein n=1 Tax=Dendryphion nanum TaxID=256645 RepID=A0A9P9DZU9_9PLEO|nr:hypothetical protein B0J11DRAFT_524387 [Dendryphion nanum]
MGQSPSTLSLVGKSKTGAWDSRPTSSEKSTFKGDKSTYSEKEAEINEKSDLKSHLHHSCSLLGLPRDIRDIIYIYALTAEDGFTYGVSNGIFCLADKFGYPPKLCYATSFHDECQYNEDYLLEDSARFKPYVSRRAEAWRIEVNQLKYVCKQTYNETRGITLSINAGKKMMFHGTRTSRNLGVVGTELRGMTRTSGMANFVHFYENCSPAQREHIRNVDIIEIPLDDEQPRRDPYLPGSIVIENRSVVVTLQNWVESIMPISFRNAPKTRMVLSEDIERRAFRRRCAEMTGHGHPDSKSLYTICQLNPALRVIVRYNEYENAVDREWIKRMCAYSMALRNGEGHVTLSDKEKKCVRQLIFWDPHMKNSSVLENLRMSTSVNYPIMGTRPDYYFMDERPVSQAHFDQRLRLEEALKLFEGGV